MNLKAARLQIHVHFHENVGECIKSKIFCGEQIQVIYILQSALTIHENYQKINYQINLDLHVVK
jgi:hypothetical protein